MGVTGLEISIYFFSCPRFSTKKYLYKLLQLFYRLFILLTWFNFSCQLQDTNEILRFFVDMEIVKCKRVNLFFDTITTSGPKQGNSNTCLLFLNDHSCLPHVSDIQLWPFPSSCTNFANDVLLFCKLYTQFHNLLSRNTSTSPTIQIALSLSPKNSRR